MKDEECLDIKYVIRTGEVTEYAKDFDEPFKYNLHLGNAS